MDQLIVLLALPFEQMNFQITGKLKENKKILVKIEENLESFVGKLVEVLEILGVT